jgi:predicted PurR-regulated permease PerM
LQQHLIDPIRRNAPRLFALAIVLLAGWILHGFLPALAWAGVIAIATWPLFLRVRKFTRGRRRNTWAAALCSVLVGLTLLVPIGFALYEIGHEVQVAAHLLVVARDDGLPAPAWLARLPAVGPTVDSWWTNVLGTPGGVAEWIHRFETREISAWARLFALQMMHRGAMLAVTLLALFFMYLHGANVGAQVIAIGRAMLGERGAQHAEHVVMAVRATVNGVVLVALGEGVLIGLGYALAGMDSAALWGALTALLAMIPFLAPLAVAGCALVLFAQGATGAAVLVLSWGWLVLFVADHFVRPVLIGGSIKLPFLWVLLGMLGGLETFGLLGLFLGPVVLTIGIALWREWLADAVAQADERPPPHRPE